MRWGFTRAACASNHHFYKSYYSTSVPERGRGSMTATAAVTHRIACIGAGYWGKNLVRNFHDLGALSWVCDLDEDRRSHLAAAYPTVRVTDMVDQVFADEQ